MPASPQPLRSMALLCLLLASLTGLAPADFPEAPLREQERAQSRIQTSTHRAGEQLDLVIDEFERNGLTGGDLEVLKAIRSVLGGLSETQMTEIVSALGEAAGAPGDNETGAKLFGAFAGQKTVIVQLRRILLEYRTQVALFELARIVRELGDRQTANLHEAIALVSSGGLEEERPSPVHRVSLQLQETEQETLREEVTTVVAKLAEIASLTSGSPDPRAAEATSFCKECGLVALLEKAAVEIKGKRMMAAVSIEKEARDSLWQLAKLLEPERSTLEKLVEALERLDRGISEEAAIAEETAEGQSPTQPLAKRQGVLADRTDFLAREIAEIAPESGKSLAEATSPMQDARTALATDDRATAEKAEAEALEKLAEARDALVAKIAEESPVMEMPEDRLTQLQQLKEDVAKMRAGQEKLKAETAPLATAGDTAALQEKSADQADLEAGTTEAAGAALEQSLPEVSALLDQAAMAMAESGGALAAGEDSPEAQEEAIAKLTEAEQQIGDKIEDLAATAAELASLEELMEQLAPMIEEQSVLGESPAEAEAQAALGERSAELAQRAEEAAPAAAESLNAASSSQQQAAQQLAASQSAAAAQSSAQEQLNAAQAALEQQAAEFAEALGREAMEMPDMAALEDIAAAIAEAQNHVAEAQEQLGSTEASEEIAQAAPALGEASQAIEPFSDQPESLPEGVGDALSTAENALAEAGAAAEAGEGDPARSEANMAADSLAQAAAAVALARAGLGSELAQSPSEGKSEGQQPGKGDQPGQGEGKQGEGNSDSPPSEQGTGDGGNYAQTSGGNGKPAANPRGTSRIIGLPERERGTLTQSKSDALPAEYGAMIEQYLKNLSDSTGEE